MLCFFVGILNCFTFGIKELESTISVTLMALIAGSIAPTVVAVKEQDKVNNEKFYQDNEKKILTTQICQLDKEIERRKQKGED